MLDIVWTNDQEQWSHYALPRRTLGQHLKCSIWYQNNYNAVVGTAVVILRLRCRP